MVDTAKSNLQKLPIIRGSTLDILINLFKIRTGIDADVPQDDPILRQCVKIDVEAGREYDTLISLRKRKSGENILRDPNDSTSLEILTKTQKAVDMGIKILQNEINDEKAKESGKLFLKEQEKYSGSLATLETTQEELQTKFKTFNKTLDEFLLNTAKSINLDTITPELRAKMNELYKTVAEFRRNIENIEKGLEQSKTQLDSLHSRVYLTLPVSNRSTMPAPTAAPGVKLQQP